MKFNKGETIMQNVRLTRKRRSMRQTRSITIILTSTITIISLFINFFNGPKLKEYKAKNNALQNELQALKKSNSSLSTENTKLNKSHSQIEQKINELTNLSQ